MKAHIIALKTEIIKWAGACVINFEINVQKSNIYIKNMGNAD